MAWTTPRTWVDGEVPTATIMNAHVRDNLKLLWHELAYVEFTAPVSVTATTAATAVQVVSAGAITFEAKPIRITFFAPSVYTSGVAGATTYVTLWDASTDLGRLGSVGQGDGTYTPDTPVHVMRRLTPTAASHTYKIMAWTTNANGTVVAGAGGVATTMPGFILIEGAES